MIAHFCRCLLARKPLPRNLLSVKDLKKISFEIEMHEAFSVFYKDAVIIVEREVDLPSLENTCIPDVFKECTWAPLLTGSVDVHHVLVQEFFSNAVVKGDRLNC